MTLYKLYSGGQSYLFVNLFRLYQHGPFLINFFFNIHETLHRNNFLI
jgi:hypothetical protein